MPKGHRTATATTCKISDLLNQIRFCVEQYPDWADDEVIRNRMTIAKGILTTLAHPLDVSDEEYALIEHISATLNERISE
jgi:hypothetical protein